MTTPTRYGDPALLVPFPASSVAAGASRGLDLSAKVQGRGGWVDLEDGQYFSLHAESFASAAQSWRKQQINNDYVEGTYTLSAVRENVTEAVSIWVRGETHLVWRQNIEVLTSAFTQIGFQFMRRMSDLVEYWTITSPADFSIATEQAYWHSRIGLFQAQLSRLPKVTFAAASEDER